MSYKDIPAAQQASVLFHQRMRVAYFARRLPQDDKDAQNVVSFYLNSLDRKLTTLRSKLGVRS